MCWCMPDGKILSVRPNVNVYYNGVVNLEDIEFILSTLWARVPLQDAFATESGVTDFHRILFNGEALTFDKFNKEHERCMAFLKDAVNQSKASKRIMVSTICRPFNCHRLISKRAASTVPLLPMRMISSRDAGRNTGSTVTPTGIPTNKLAERSISATSWDMSSQRSAYRTLGTSML